MKTVKIIMLMFAFAVLYCNAAAQGININSGGRIIADGNINIVVDAGGFKNDGVFAPDSSTVIFSGGPITAISGTQPSTFFNLTFRGTGSKLNEGSASVISTLAVDGTTTIDADGAANNRAFTLLSSDTSTARVDVLTTGSISGNVTVERFINTGTGPGEHGKSWQFLATPTTGQTIFQSWQENGTTPTGYGTWITGTGSGFDVQTANPALKVYDPTINEWIGVSTTAGQLVNPKGYMLFVRGDRTVVTYNGTPNNTNMRSKGVLFTPANPPPSVPVPANAFQTFGNPYASRIEFNRVFLASSNINNVFYVWDPKLSGSYNVGGYQTLSGITGYIPTAGSATTYYPAGIPAPNIESGQAVFVHSSGPAAMVNFNENIKVSGNRLVHKGADLSGEELPLNRQFFMTSLFTSAGFIADGNIVAFERGFGNDMSTLDAEKIMNAGENFGLIRDRQVIAVEAREPVVIDDTLFYYMKNLRYENYQLRFARFNFPAGITAYLVDRFTGNVADISVTDSSFYNFSVSAAEESNAAERFMVVFRPAIKPDDIPQDDPQVDGPAGITVYPNPVINNSIYIRFKGQPAGRYSVTLLDATGRKVLATFLNVSGTSHIQEIKLGKLAAASYQLMVTGQNTFSKSILVQ